ncbi:MAG: hypothetical protein CMH46_08760 [Muricauda sp.]|nr:hypothetical protein [Allomuricauda sp.]
MSDMEYSFSRVLVLMAYNDLIYKVSFWVLSYVNLFTKNLKGNKIVPKLVLDAVGTVFLLFSREKHF